MNDYAIELAKEFKKRDNPKPIGNVRGIVTAVGADWEVVIQDYNFKINKTNGYICNQILERKTVYDFKHSASGSISISCAEGGGSHSLNESGKGEVHLHEVWKVGDYVMVSPDARGEYFFIVDIIR